MWLGKVETLLILLAIVGILAVLAGRLRMPFPIMMVCGGVLIAAIPGLPKVSLDPTWVLIVFLPPILYSSAFSFPLDELQHNARPILLMATGLVLMTVFCTGWAAHWLIPGLPLAAAFVLGAIVSPPDAVAATSIFHRMQVPQRLITVLEGESLINDASGLVAYAFGVSAVVLGSFSIESALGDFLWVTIGGIGWGWLIGWGIGKLHSHLEESTTGIALQILTPYFTYLSADHFKMSGVLAVVTVGLSVGNRAQHLLNPQTRIEGVAVWNFINFFLNGVIFILIGLEFPHILHRLKDQSLVLLLGYGFAVALVVIAVRFFWMFVIAPLLAHLLPRMHHPIHFQPRVLMVASWAGMRGIVSLAAALALPKWIENGAPFPQRDLIIFITYCVIFVTLVLQGISLPWVIRKMGLNENTPDAARERHARILLFQKALERIEQEADKKQMSTTALQLFRQHFQTRIDHLQFQTEKLQDPEGLNLQEMGFMTVLVRALHQELIALRREGIINETIRRNIAWDFDSEELRLRRLFEH